MCDNYMHFILIFAKSLSKTDSSRLIHLNYTQIVECASDKISLWNFSHSFHFGRRNHLYFEFVVKQRKLKSDGFYRFAYTVDDKSIVCGETQCAMNMLIRRYSSADASDRCTARAAQTLFNTHVKMWCENRHIFFFIRFSSFERHVRRVRIINLELYVH